MTHSLTDRGRCWEMLLHLKNLCWQRCTLFIWSWTEELVNCTILSIERTRWWFFSGKLSLLDFYFSCPCSTFSYPCSTSLSSLSLKRCWWFSPLQFCCNLCLTTTMLQVHWNALQCTKAALKYTALQKTDSHLSHTLILYTFCTVHAHIWYILPILHSARSDFAHFTHFAE